MASQTILIDMDSLLEHRFSSFFHYHCKLTRRHFYSVVNVKLWFREKQSGCISLDQILIIVQLLRMSRNIGCLVHLFCRSGKTNKLVAWGTKNSCLDFLWIKCWPLHPHDHKWVLALFRAGGAAARMTVYFTISEAMVFKGGLFPVGGRSTFVFWCLVYKWWLGRAGDEKMPWSFISSAVGDEFSLLW